MRWLWRNIGSWGGNPENILIFGQSSGAASVAAHLVMEGSAGLFQKAVMESGSFPNWGSHSWEAAEHNYELILTATQCALANGYRTEEQQLQCLLDAPAAELLSASQQVPVACRDGCSWAPVVDGVELPDTPLRLLQQGQGQRAPSVPVLQVTMRDDGADYTYVPHGGGGWGATVAATEQDVDEYWSRQYGDALLPALQELYPASAYRSQASSDYSAANWAAFSSESDFAYYCPAQWAAAAFSSGGAAAAGVDYSVDWFINGRGYEALQASVGETVSFSWSDGWHELRIHPTGTCDAAGATLIGDNSEGTSYTFSQDDCPADAENDGSGPATVTFACDHYMHCEGGQIITFNLLGCQSRPATPSDQCEGGLGPRLQAVHDECCDEPGEDCSSGAPASCNPGCALVLLPFLAEW